ncbi:MAG: phytoene desaturase [Candidatus Uhrbacteria bacterium GW2011_GWE2_45_35]|uniref:Phytoene desaturase n=2 Tax=Candidatus Uhriibacteriota TaxID=1752732 RepID=A0A0G1JFE6_9BACT|nr:MAG: phytoene desaturase [Candidatus Uhrbacteria bacterium GW2011_GWF2_44_350]KKU06854.1 MAG: phytoene desaturase [Candidatus Uhrbacteria bacterium GW2011_GWE2_45_35]HBR80771.1 phytoene desaturase [Candidatus Uhrbacteria bacterium]HCU31775.1 phytoene desaturase [Candidatus Uhrbacteria bacterium]
MSNTRRKKIIIVGAGPGGLSAGMLLAHKGFEVKIFEKEKIPGGRNGFLKLGEYKFDIGPTFFMMDNILREIFKTTGRNLDDYVKMTSLLPMYRLYFPDNYLDVYDDQKKMKKELARVFPGEENGLAKFHLEEKKRLAALYPILSADNNNILATSKPEFLKAIPSFSIGRSLFSVMGDYFKDERCRLSFTFQSKYLGMSPWDCPGAFAMVPFIEHNKGVYHIEGGLSSAAEAMAKVIQEDGGKIHYGKSVKKILTERGRAVGVELNNGKKFFSGAVVINADFSYAASELLSGLKKYSKKKLEKKKYSCSIFMLYLGVNKKFNLPHHAIVFAKNYRQNIEDVFSGKLTKEDFSFYVRDASKTDSTLAPKGKSALYVLVPVPNNRSKINWQKSGPKIRNRVLELMRQRLKIKIDEADIEVEKIISPTDWQKDFNVYQGAVFNLSHHLDQMLWFRPHNEFEEIKDCYLVGGGTHPGSGLPTIYESGRITANLIAKKFS